MWKILALIFALCTIIFLSSATLIYIYLSNKSNNNSESNISSCELMRSSCMNDPICRIALSYYETFCLYSNPSAQCSKYCQTMITCITSDPEYENLLRCSCENNIISCNNYNYTHCLPNYNIINDRLCENLINCDPWRKFCSSPSSSSSLLSSTLSSKIKYTSVLNENECNNLNYINQEDCIKLFNNYKCTNICKLNTRISWNNRLEKLMNCICIKFNSACELEKHLIVQNCLNTNSDNTDNNIDDHSVNNVADDDYDND